MNTMQIPIKRVRVPLAERGPYDPHCVCSRCGRGPVLADGHQADGHRADGQQADGIPSAPVAVAVPEPVMAAPVVAPVAAVAATPISVPNEKHLTKKRKSIKPVT